jgi:hypothetical protein
MWCVILLIGVTACGSKVGSDAEGSEGATSGNGSSDSADESGSATGGSSGLTHGIVQLEFHRGESQPDTPFPGTTRIVATMEYLECLSAFYDQNPALRQEGPDGAKIFGSAALGGEGWLERLCTPLVDVQIDCEVVEIDQRLEVIEQLTVVYAVSGEIEGGRIAFGPLPTAELAQCEAGLDPRIRVSSNGAVKGTTDDGTVVWETEAFSPAEAITNQGAPIRIAAAAG